MCRLPNPQDDHAGVPARRAPDVAAPGTPWATAARALRAVGGLQQLVLRLQQLVVQRAVVLAGPLISWR